VRERYGSGYCGIHAEAGEVAAGDASEILCY
jgi:hypothetical protein